MERWHLDLDGSIPFDWDVEVWENFNHILDEIVLVDESTDKIIWSPSTLGNYSWKSFKKKLSINFPS